MLHMKILLVVAKLIALLVAIFIVNIFKVNFLLRQDCKIFFSL